MLVDHIYNIPVRCKCGETESFMLKQSLIFNLVPLSDQPVSPRRINKSEIAFIGQRICLFKKNIWCHWCVGRPIKIAISVCCQAERLVQKLTKGRKRRTEEKTNNFPSTQLKHVDPAFFFSTRLQQPEKL